MGLFGGSTTTTTNTNFDTGPSKFQKPYLDQAFTGAQSIYNQQAGTPWYQGDLYAGMSDQAKSALQSMYGYAGGNLGGAQGIAGIGLGQAQYGANAGGLINDYLQASDPNTMVHQANRYANNPYLNAQIDAVGSDIARNLNENTITGINRGASGGGNINSSRSGIAEGVARRGAAEELSQIASGMRSNAWDQGMGLAQQNAAAKLGAANAYMGLGQQGIDAFRAGTELGYGSFDRQLAAEGMGQQDRQGYLDQDFDQWLGQDERAWDLLNRYYGVVGANQWGQSGTENSKSKSKQSGSILGSILGAASTAAAFMPSDRRLKENIAKLFEMEDGLGVYTYNYVWDKARQMIGVMADEVAKLRPEALGPTVGGYATVNYEKI